MTCQPGLIRSNFCPKIFVRWGSPTAEIWPALAPVVGGAGVAAGVIIDPIAPVAGAIGPIGPSCAETWLGASTRGGLHQDILKIRKGIAASV
mmetsp:Transcript_107146/g.279784  ORF Transcript_107146/g.279784 Transcript_107146/m.279784 type:complete len:92 (+) Transcript_107146:726-1001(+)